MRPSYTVTYEPTTVLGEHGYEYVLMYCGRVVAQGWTRGKKHHAEAEARAAMDRRAA